MVQDILNHVEGERKSLEGAHKAQLNELAQWVGQDQKTTARAMNAIHKERDAALQQLKLVEDELSAAMAAKGAIEASSKSHQEDIARLRLENEQHRERIVDLIGTHETAANALAGLHVENTALQSKNDAMLIDLRAAESELGAAERLRSSHSAQSTERHARLVALERQLAELSSANVALETEVRTARSERAGCQEQLAAVSARAAQADQQLNDLAAESQLLAGAKQEQAAMLRVLHERSDAERHATSRALEELEHERREGARLQLSLRTAEVDADALRKRLDGMEEELRRESHALQQCRGDLQVHIAAATSLRDRLERSESALADSKHERDELRQVR